MNKATTKTPSASYRGTDRIDSDDRGLDHPDHHPAERNARPSTSSVRLLRAAEVQRILGIGRSKTYELMANGELPVVKIGRSVRVPAAALDEWVAARTVKSDSEKSDL